ncbi:MAG: hybrid sensor histidine kinase/response regulator transcription factor, partial [Saprospiraceae bacterium]
WVDSGLTHTANYAQLRPGNYTFEVQGNIGYGDWSPSSTLRISVLPPWWATWWAYSFYFLLLATTVYGIIYFFKKRIRLQHQLKLKFEEANKLKELDSFKSQLFTNLTHEFRTPLTVILGMTHQLENGPWQNGIAEKEKGKIGGALKMIENNGKNLLHLINQLLDLSKLENKSFQLNLKQDDIVSYLRYVTESFQSYANGNNLSLRFITAVESLVMDYDAEQIKQVVTNLISNALKFTPSGGDIVVKLTHVASTLGIIVTDTGIGISESELPKIFERFYQVDSSSTRAAQGTGIGLAHAQELVKVMGGQIIVESVAGKGTSLIVELPVTNLAVLANSGSHEYSSAQPVPISGLHRNGLEDKGAQDEFSEDADNGLPHLLIVEDNPDVVFYLRSCLENDYQIIVAYNGEIGIEKAFEDIPDFIISDVMMPVKDGYQVCDTLKNDERTSHIPIILLTAKADAVSRLTGLRRGADAYLSKPFLVEELLLQISVLLDNRRRMAAHFSRTIHVGSVTAVEDAIVMEAIVVEDAFVTKVKSVIESHYPDENFSLPQLCVALGMSRSQLFRKMKAVTDTSPSDLIRSYRLIKAKSLLETGETTVAEATYQVGFKDPSYFSKMFLEEFGVLPGSIIK